MNKTKLVLLRKRNNGIFVAEPVHVRFWRAVDRKSTDKCWEWMGNRHHKGYGEFALPKGSNKTRDKTHRIAWELTNGKIPKGMMVCHRCDNPPCCNPEHLFLGNAKTNKGDCVEKRRHTFGERSPKAKLTESQIVEIRRLDKAGKTRLSIAKQYGVSGRSITAVCRYESWAHVK